MTVRDDTLISGSFAFLAIKDGPAALAREVYCWLFVSIITISASPQVECALLRARAIPIPQMLTLA